MAEAWFFFCSKVFGLLAKHLISIPGIRFGGSRTSILTLHITTPLLTYVLTSNQNFSVGHQQLNITPPVKNTPITCGKYLLWLELICYNLSKPVLGFGISLPWMAIIDESSPRWEIFVASLRLWNGNQKTYQWQHSWWVKYLLLYISLSIMKLQISHFLNVDPFPIVFQSAKSCAEARCSGLWSLVQFCWSLRSSFV